MQDSPQTRVEPTVLMGAMTRRLRRRTEATATFTLPAVPSMLDEYVGICEKLFAAFAVDCTPAERERLTAKLDVELTKAFKRASRSNIVISFHKPQYALGLTYDITAQCWSVENEYERWVSFREPPFFGTHPDARVWELAREAADPATCRILDVGAGTGRNALALARRGHPVDAVEITAAFADIIRADAERDALNVTVVDGDVFTYLERSQHRYELVIFSEVVPDFRNTAELRGMFDLAAECLAPGGRLVFNAFLARDGYVPDTAAREFGQQCDSMIFTLDEVTTAAAGTPLTLVSDDSAYEYEKAHLPAEAWPPTAWFENWAQGLDVFDVEAADSPMELRWLVYSLSTE